MRRAAFIFCVFGTSVFASEHTVYLEDNAGDRIEIAQLSIADDKSYAITMADAAFTDHFLSMRPFKCLEGSEKHWCHVPYPYEIRRNISADVVDLEYDFLFLWKRATDYGIDTWNGVYYRLEETAGGWTGAMHEVDLGAFGIPPEEGNLRPIEAKDIHEADPDSHWLPRLVID